MTVDAIRGDITGVDTDAIVNAANEGLRRGSGVCGAIFAAAGPQLDEACERIGHCATGEAVATPGFALPARWIIHTVGPVWYGGSSGEPAQLASCYRRSLEVAAEHGIKTIAFPGISTGIYGYPLEDATPIAISTVVACLAGMPAIEEVRFVTFGDEATKVAERILAEVQAGPSAAP
jgi:O-acetyl-ADP-ribose deacetylase